MSGQDVCPIYRRVRISYPVNREIGESVLYIFPTFQLSADGPKILVAHKKNDIDGSDTAFRQSIATLDGLDLDVIKIEMMDLIPNSFRTKIFSSPILVSCEDGDPVAHYCANLFIGAKHRNYSYKMVDRLLSDELWPVNGASLLFADVEFIVSGVLFKTHRAILSARSPVFAAMFTSEMNDAETARVEVTDVLPETFADFLRFVYTGRLDTPCFANSQLGYCADKYQVKTLSDLCQVSTVEQDSDALEAALMSCEDAVATRTIIHETEELEIDSDCYYVHEFQWEPADGGQYDFGGIQINIQEKAESIRLQVWNPSWRSLSVVSVMWFCPRAAVWLIMEERELPESGHCWAGPPFGPVFFAIGCFKMMTRIDFRIIIGALDGDYPFCLVDELHGNQLWSAATNRQFTDVEFVVGGRSFHAHRAILAARSKEFAEMFSPEDRIQSVKYEIADCDPSAFEQFLFFVYTGILQASANNSSLLQLADKYGIVTLSDICEWALETSFQSVTDDDLLLKLLVDNAPRKP